MSENTPSRKPTNLSLNRALLDEARSLNVNLSRAAEAGIAEAVTQARSALWRAENATALDSSNRLVAKRGVPGQGGT